MKKTKLLSIINKAINEVLEESLYAEKPGADTSNTLPNVISPDANTEKDPKFQSKYKKIAEGELDEARRYGIADDARAQNLINTTSGKAQTRIQQIVDAINDSGGRLSGGGIARALNVVQPQINNLLRTMVEAGILDIEGGTAFSTPQAAAAAGEEEEGDDEQSGFLGDETDMVVGNGNYDKLMAQYFGLPTTPEATGEETEEEPIITPPTEDIPEETEDDIIASGSVGKWLVYNSDLIQAIIDKAKLASKRISNIREANNINVNSYKEYAKMSLGILIDKLVEKLKVVKLSNPTMLEKILLNLKIYKFVPTNTLRNYKEIIKKLDTVDVSNIPIDTVDISNIPIDNDDLEIDDENDEEMLDKPIMERFQKLAKIIR
jgi:hypothetical protein